MLQHGWTLRTSEMNQSQKGQTLYDSFCKQYLKQSNSQEQKLEWWLPGAGGGELGSQGSTGTEFWFYKRKKFWNVNILNTTELYTLKW